MAGLYIHVPFCKQACHYCDFHFSTNTSRQALVVKSICEEIILQRGYLPDTRLETIYFGGGTPSLLTADQIAAIAETIYRHYIVDANAEITLEANPDDLNYQTINGLKKSFVNRLSIGIQSFHEPHLRFMHRAHTTAQAETCVKAVQDAGFRHLTIDLIYGIPHTDHSVWHRDLEIALNLDVPHFSAYCLSIEPDTVFGRWVKQKKLPPADEDFGAEQFEILMETMEAAGYEQYEISNFARNDQYARHNSGYWRQKPYLGVGPSAHSFNGSSRQANVSNNTEYVKAIGQRQVPAIVEVLSQTDQINDYILTSLRTRWGCNLAYVRHRWGHDIQMANQDYLLKTMQNGLIACHQESIFLTRSGRMLADEITAHLLVAADRL